MNSAVVILLCYAMLSAGICLNYAGRQQVTRCSVQWPIRMDKNLGIAINAPVKLVIRIHDLIHTDRVRHHERGLRLAGNLNHGQSSTAKSY